MEVLNKILYWISTGLMLPVVVGLLFLFLRALAALGSFYGLYVNRLKAAKKVTPFLGEVASSGLTGQQAPTGKDRIFASLEHLLQAVHSPVNREKILSDFELAMSKQLSTTKNMSKLGPVLGLMGTLIPMGPALVGLASGDITSMAENMQVAFSTTVVGLIVGAIGFTLTEVKQRWFAKDLSLLYYISDLISEEHAKKEK
ncbi:MotA/TolQ/ExbB proton channel family protein [Rapidithrix thailandica]|uniref:MotA/TolQ/ExbB proton channel family protein n=1 Tax=Rapidithrix thailandica TaxID=413964 RepID=A0AAW9RYN0_9BACT